MAAPHVSGVATLLQELHPGWSPQLIKAAIMNQSTQKLKDNLLGEPVSATVMGAGRVRAAASAAAVSVAEPASLSYGLEAESGPTSEVQTFNVRNLDDVPHNYTVSGAGPRYSDFGASPARVRISIDGGSFGSSRSFTLPGHSAKKVSARLDLDTVGDRGIRAGVRLVLLPPERRRQRADRRVRRRFDRPPARPLARRPAGGLRQRPLEVGARPHRRLRHDEDDLEPDARAGRTATSTCSAASTGWRATARRTSSRSAPARSRARTPGTASPRACPTGTDEFGGISWLDFLADPDAPGDPVEFGVQTAGVHNTTETLEVDVLVDRRADGVYAGDDEGIPADYLVVKQAAPGGEVCVFNLALPNALDDCTATYFADYSNYNSNLVGLVVSAEDIGLNNNNARLAYQVTACTGTFTGDVPGQFCDTAGDVDPSTGIYTARLNASDPALDIDPLVCRGFWDGGACNAADPIEVSTGSAGPGDDPDILALFPNNAPSRNPTVVTTNTGP